MAATPKNSGEQIILTALMLLTAVAWAPPGAVAKEKEKEKRRGKGEEGARRKKARAPE